MSTPAVTLLLAVFNNEAVLDRTLLALNRQSFRDFEVIICDDGSSPDVKTMVDGLAQRVDYPLSHVWHDNRGFRKCRILNRGVSLAAADYIIVLDPDCIPHRHFVRGHLEERRLGCYLAGRRLLLGDRLSRTIQNGEVNWCALESIPRLLSLWIKHRGGRHLEAGVYLPRVLRRLFGRGRLALKGCNMSFWKADIEAINGFEETFEVPCGGEDTDLERRFKAIGLLSRSVKHAAICYHLHHPLLPRDGQADALCRELKSAQTVQARRGLAQQGEA